MSIMTENIIMTPPAAPLQLDLGMDIFNNMPVDDFMGGGPSSEENGSIATTSTYPNDPEHPNDPELDRKRQAYVQIVEQPQPKALRFRYICEGRSAGSIPGIRSIAENKTFPTIKIIGYKGPAVVVVSCVTVDEPHRPHPHNLVGKEGCNKGVCTVTITDSDSMECAFSNLGIQCVKKRDVEDALKQRKNIRVDPFGTGFSHGNNHNQPIDLNAVRLCFQVFLSNSENRRFTFPLKPVVSDPIFDKKATSDLKICKLSECTSCVSGGKDIILLCEKVTKEDIQIRFFEEKDGRIEWEAFGEFLPADVHKQVAISFKTPKYKNLDVTISVSCFIQLQRTSDKSCTSEPLPFEYIPMDADPLDLLGPKRKRGDEFQRILMEKVNNVADFSENGGAARTTRVPYRQPRSPYNHQVKPEPQDPFCHSPDSLCGMTTVKSPISPPHNTSGGRLLYPTPLQPNVIPFQFVPSPPNGSLIGLASPPSATFYHMQQRPLEPCYSPLLPVASPFSPEIQGATAAVYSVPCTTEQSLMNFDPHLAAVVASGLPDLGPMTSSEFGNTDISMANLSDNLVNSLNIVDHFNGLNNLNVDKKSQALAAALEKKSASVAAAAGGNVSEICTPNISLNEPM